MLNVAQCLSHFSITVLLYPFKISVLDIIRCLFLELYYFTAFAKSKTISGGREESPRVGFSNHSRVEYPAAGLEAGGDAAHTS